MMADPFVLSFKKSVSLIEQSGEVTALQTANATLSLQHLSPGLLAAIQILCTDGATEEHLSNVVLQSDGFSILPKFYYYLEKFISFGIICHTIHADGFPLATIVPISPAYKFQFSEVALEKKYILSRFAYCHTKKSQMLLESPLSHAQIILADWRGGALITELAKSQNSRELCTKIPSISEEVVQRLLSLLWSGTMLSEVQENDKVQEEENNTLVQWEFHDLLFHSRSREGRNNKSVALNQRFLDKIEPLPAIKSEVSQERINLYKPDIQKLKEVDSPFTFVLEERKSIRNYGNQPITDQQLGEFLYRSARVREFFPLDNMECSNRPYPSGGACYELELYIIVNTCENIPSGLYHYCPQNHQLGKLCPRNNAVERLLIDARIATVGQRCLPQVLIILAARFPRVSWSYESLAYATILKDVGVLFQTMYLVATAMNLAPCAMAGGNSDLFSEVAGVDYYAESSVGEFRLGSKAMD